MRFIVRSVHRVVQANFLSPNVYRIIANVVGDASVVALTPALQSQSVLATAEAQMAAEVAVVEM